MIIMVYGIDISFVSANVQTTFHNVLKHFGHNFELWLPNYSSLLLIGDRVSSLEGGNYGKPIDVFNVCLRCLCK